MLKNSEKLGPLFTLEVNKQLSPQDLRTRKSANSKTGFIVILRAPIL